LQSQRIGCLRQDAAMNPSLVFALWSVALLAGGTMPSSASENQRSLREAAARRFGMGVGISDRISEHTNDWPLLTAQFGTVTPENCMKPVAVQPVEGQFNFAQADAFVEFAARQRLRGRKQPGTSRSAPPSEPPLALSREARRALR
jgi:GH35 family endo-1,4-beta-xylanase